jgi:hypothetical protein
VTQDLLVRKVLRASREFRESKDPLVHKELKDLRVLKGRRDRPELMELMARPC